MMYMTTSVTATFDGNVLIPSGKVDLPKGTVLRLRVELETQAQSEDPALASLPACGIWSDRTDLDSTQVAARQLRQRVENREDHAK